MRRALSFKRSGYRIGSMKIRMYQNKVLIEPLDPEKDEEYKDSIIEVPQSITKGLAKGVVVAIGECKIRVGERVIYSSQGSLPFKHEGKEYVLISENQIFAGLDSEYY